MIAIRISIILVSTLLLKTGKYANEHFDGLLDYGDIYFVWIKYAQWIWEGYVPYVDFQLEFPPLFLLIIYVPYIFFKIIGILPYGTWFALFQLIPDMIALKLLLELNQNENLKEVIYLWVYFLPIPLLLLVRFDLWAITATLASVKKWSENKYEKAVAYAILGVFVKLFPGLLLLHYSRKLIQDKKRLLKIIGISFAEMAPFLIIYPLLFGLKTIEGYIGIITFHEGKAPLKNSLLDILIGVFQGHEIDTFYKIGFFVGLAIIPFVKKDTNDALFSSFLFFALFFWRYTPQYFIWAIPFATTRKRALFVTILYAFAFGVFIIANIYTFTQPTYVPVHP